MDQLQARCYSSLRYDLNNSSGIMYVETRTMLHIYTGRGNY